MPCNLTIGDTFPDLSLPDHTGRTIKLSKLTHYSQMDERLGFEDGYPLIVIFYRGFFCPRDQQQMRMLCEFQEELRVNFCKLVTISAEPSLVQAAFRGGLGANWPFLSDEDREVVKSLDILDETEGEYAYKALPYTFVLKPDLTIHNIYDGWFFVGRPTLEELRQDLRTVMSELSYYSYDVYNSDHARQLRIPQQEWLHGAPELGANGLPVLEGAVKMFNLNSGNGTILSDDGREVFFNFTAIPGEGYRTVKPGQRVAFELVETFTGLSARNVQAKD
ncbi:MAG: redoxin domain-containing protein [Bacteroidota bacterium]